ncbi:HEAT repeat domain-containing protein, partial [Planctomycetota bacterium]
APADEPSPPAERPKDRKPPSFNPAAPPPFVPPREGEEPSFAGGTVTEWVKVLKHEPESRRLLAVDALAAMGHHAAAAVPGLTEVAQNGSAALRINAISALGQIGAAAKESVPVLLLCLRSEDVQTRMHAAAVLGKIGEEAAYAVPALVVALEDRAPMVRHAAARSLNLLGPSAVAFLEPLLDEQDAETRRRAVRGLSYGRRAACAGLTRAATDPDRGVRSAAIKAARRVTPGTENLRAALSRALVDPATECRHEAVITLSAYEGLPEEVVDRIFARLEDPAPEVRMAVLAAIMKRRRIPERNRRWVREAFFDPLAEIRKRACSCLALCLPADPETHKILLGVLLSDPVAEVRTAAAWTFALLRELETKTIVGLLQAMKRNGAKRAPAMAINRLKDHQLTPVGDEALTVFIGATGDPDDLVRQIAITMIGRIIGLSDSTPSAEAIRALAQALGDSRERIRRTALRTLRDIGPNGLAAVPAIEALKSDPELGDMARQALLRIRGAAKRKPPPARGTADPQEPDPGDASKRDQDR